MSTTTASFVPSSVRASMTRSGNGSSACVCLTVRWTTLPSRTTSSASTGAPGRSTQALKKGFRSSLSIFEKTSARSPNDADFQTNSR